MQLPRFIPPNIRFLTIIFTLNITRDDALFGGQLFHRIMQSYSNNRGPIHRLILIHRILIIIYNAYFHHSYDITNEPFAHREIHNSLYSDPYIKEKNYVCIGRDLKLNTNSLLCLTFDLNLKINTFSRPSVTNPIKKKPFKSITRQYSLSRFVLMQC